jgi:hypothetical protein
MTLTILATPRNFPLPCAPIKLKDGENWDETIFNVFRKTGSITSGDLRWRLHRTRRARITGPAIWALLDMTPDGRGDWFPKVNYDE